MNRLAEFRAADGYVRWSSRTERPLQVLAVVFLVGFVIPLYRPDLPAAARAALSALSVVVWVAFVVDYVARLGLAPDRRAFVRGHVPDLLVLAVPLLRPLRLLRLVGVFTATTDRAGGRTQARALAVIVGATAALVVAAGGLALDAERGVEGSNIVTTSDALWWASTTVTTVGYGDRFPTTDEGRVVGVLLMLGGIALLGVVTASIAAWFVSRFEAVERADRAEEDATLAALRDLAARLDRLERRLVERP